MHWLDNTIANSIHFRYYNWQVGHKMKLKTLKDFKEQAESIDGTYGCQIEDFFLPRIQEEAIKWIKEIENKGKEGYIDGVCINPCDEYCCSAIVDFIKHFFNLTEGGLK